MTTCMPTVPLPPTLTACRLCLSPLHDPLSRGLVPGAAAGHDTVDWSLLFQRTRSLRSFSWFALFSTVDARLLHALSVSAPYLSRLSLYCGATATQFVCALPRVRCLQWLRLRVETRTADDADSDEWMSALQQCRYMRTVAVNIAYPSLPSSCDYLGIDFVQLGAK